MHTTFVEFETVGRRVVLAAIGLWLIVTGCSSSSPDAGAAPPASEVSDVDSAALQAIADERRFAVISVTGDMGNVAVAAGSGHEGSKIRPEDPFFVGSTTKMVTAAAILQLVDAGQVVLDAPAGDYLPYELDPSITVRHLLQHKSGITAEDPWTCDPIETRRLLEEVASEGPTTEPGSDAWYSTTGFMFLGEILEVVSGQDPAALMREAIFDPLGMDSTYFAESETGPEPITGMDAGDACPGTTTTTGTGGGLVSNAPDLEAFVRALHDGSLLSPESLDEMLHPGATVFGIDYGLGVGLLTAADGRVLYGHWGTMGFDGGVFYDPDTGQSIVVASPQGTFSDLLWAADDWAAQQ